jgi:alkaline phosphatase D
MASMNANLPQGLSNQRRQLLLLAWASSLGTSAGLMSGCAMTGAAFVKELQGANPFALGVASGCPQTSSIVLWTRLSTPSASAKQIPNVAVEVQWQLAEDDSFTRIVASGIAHALPELGHSIHVEPRHLKPHRRYWYRFRVGDAVSPIGSTMTAPLETAMPSKLRIVLASCQHWELGYFQAWKHAAAENPDVILFTGDYIYEYGANMSAGRARQHNSPEVTTLEGYRGRYALYKSDHDLQAAHAAAPWITTWDDHEVANDYAAGQDEHFRPNFDKRRAAAYQAYWENMPVPIHMLNIASLPAMQIYARYSWGKLAQLHMLDDRQYRDPQACPPNQRSGAGTVWRDECVELDNPKRSLLGTTQESWLADGLKNDASIWTVIGQQTLMAHMNQAMGENFDKGRERFWTDGWNGYQPARERLLQSLKDAQNLGSARDTLVLGGDVHAWYLADLQLQKEVARNGRQAPIIASEVCGTSITSGSWPQELSERIIRNLPHYHYTRSDKRGYTLIDLNQKTATFQLKAVGDVKQANSPIHVDATFGVEKGRPGIQRA